MIIDIHAQIETSRGGIIKLPGTVLKNDATFILKGVEETAQETLTLVKGINAEMEALTAEIKDKIPKIYSRELMDLLFYEFYTKSS